MRDEIDEGSAATSPRARSSEGHEPDLAALIESSRRDATMEGRLAAVSLTLFPVLIAIMLLAFDANTSAAVRSAGGVAILLAAAVLTAAGTWWLWRIAAPPFAAFPQRRSILERQPQTAYELSVILHQAANAADQGMEVADALEHAAPEEASHPSRVLAMGLRLLLESGGDDQVAAEDGHPGRSESKSDHPEKDDARSATDNDGSDADGTSDPNAEASRSAADEARSELPDWLIATLQPAWTDSDPVETLDLVAGRIRAELREAAIAWPGRVRIAALVPFGVCILPAAVLLALLAFR